MTHLQELLARVERMVQSGELAGVQNDVVATFEAELARLGCVPHAVATASGTLAIELALEAAGIGRGHEVIVPALAAFGTLAAVVRRGAIPVVVDVEADRLTLDPRGVRKALTGRTRAAIAVHAMGIAPDFATLRTALGNHLLVEDAAQGFPTRIRGDVGTVSLSAAKAIDVGEGGAVLTDDPDVALAVRWLTCLGHSGVSVDGRTVDLAQGHLLVGTSARLAGLQAALGLYRTASLQARLDWMETSMEALREAGRARGLTPLARPDTPLAAVFRGTLPARLRRTLPLLRQASVYPAHKEAPLAAVCRVTPTPVADEVFGQLVVLATDVLDDAILGRTLTELGSGP